MWLSYFGFRIIPLFNYGLFPTNSSAVNNIDCELTKITKYSQRRIISPKTCRKYKLPLELQRLEQTSLSFRNNKKTQPTLTDLLYWTLDSNRTLDWKTSSSIIISDDEFKEFDISTKVNRCPLAELWNMLTPWSGLPNTLAKNIVAVSNRQTEICITSAIKMKLAPFSNWSITFQNAHHIAQLIALHFLTDEKTVCVVKADFC